MKKEIELERQFKVLANRRRLSILLYLRNRKEASVGDIAIAIKLSLPSTSKHLVMLERASFVEKEQRSLNVFYRIALRIPQVVRYAFEIS